MEAFIDSLDENQLALFENAIQLARLVRKGNRYPYNIAMATAMAPIASPPPPPQQPQKQQKKKMINHRLFIPYVQCPEGYAVVHDRLVGEMRDVRSRKIYINEERENAKITYDTPALAAKAKEHLDEFYEDIKIY